MAEVYKIAAIEAARIAGESSVMDAAADSVASVARGLAGAHKLTGNYLSNIGTERTPGKRGVTDRLVYVDDPAASFIEWGHMTRPSEEGQPQHWVNGLHIMGRAAGVR